MAMATLILDVPRSRRPYASSEVLDYYDGPLLFWLPETALAHGELLSGASYASVFGARKLLVLALPEDAGDWPFLVAAVEPKMASAMEANKVTLLDAMQSAIPAGHCYLMRDYGADLLELQPLTEVLDDWLPGDVSLAGAVPV